MKRRLFAIWLLLPALFAWGQDSGFDMQTLSEPDITGSARYVGLSGAMGALGGDWSAVKDNPAGLGVYRGGELSLTFADQFKSRPGASGWTQTATLPTAFWVFCMSRSDRQTGVLSNSVALSYQRLRSYRGDWYGVSTAASSAYDVQLGVQESGSQDAYSFAWGMNISNRWYVGLSANVLSLTYQKNSDYYYLSDGSSYESIFSTSGIAANAQVGLICRPVAGLRIGASFQTPSFASLRYTAVSDSGYSESTTLSRKMPLRSTFSAAYIFSTYGLLSLEYDYQHGFQSQLTDVHLLKAGGEVVIRNHFFLDLGYALQLAGPYKTDENVLEPSSFRSDTDFRRALPKHYASCGFAYRNRFISIGLAYQFSYRNYESYASASQRLPYLDQQVRTHALVISLSWCYRR